MSLTTFRRAFFYLLTLALGLIDLTHSTSVIAEGPDQLVVGNFSLATPGEPLPQGWKPLTFDNIPEHTQYDLVKDEQQVVVKAISRQSSSGLIREISIDPKEYPVIEWRWKVENILQKGDVAQKSGDDYPARLYITFQYDSSQVGFFEKAKFETIKLLYGQYPPIGAINYIWESKSPIGTMVPNPYTDRVYMFVTQSGSANLNQWVTQERNIYEDYKKAFGEDPPNISGVAIMTDTDNTRESAIAYFGDIVFKKSVKE
ncbi:MAG: hypothetical protein NPIRA06_06330 [Nitrospirales bacterium]|nr:MAG: hypothetical protein NPIRA06_06330 [Nitrospirales bacterium]